MLNMLLQTHSRNGFINYGNRKQKDTAGLGNTKVIGPETGESRSRRLASEAGGWPWEWVMGSPHVFG